MKLILLNTYNDNCLKISQLHTDETVLKTSKFNYYEIKTKVHYIIYIFEKLKSN